MAREQIPDDVVHFILTSIASVPYLEAALLLRSEPYRAWDRRRLAQRLYMTERAAQELLSELHRTGVLARDNDDPASYRYQPESDQLQDMFDRLSDAYSKNLVDVANLIHSKAGAKSAAGGRPERKGS